MNFRNVFAAIVFSFLFVFGGAAHSELLVGAGRADITPEPGCFMGGYYMRNGKATDVNDRLYARALMFDNGSAKAVLVTLDLVIIGGVLVNEVKAKIEEKLGISPEMVSISVTHTHSGPQGYYEEYGKYPKIVDMEMKRFMKERMLEAVQEANDILAPATVGFTSFQLKDFNRNRHDPNGPVDRTAVLMLARDPDGKPVAGFLNFAAHPTVLGADNLDLSGDWAGLFAQAMERKLGEGVVFQFMQGAAGNLSPASKHGSTFISCEDIAERMSDEVLSHSEEAKPVSEIEIAGAIKKLILPVKSNKDLMAFARALPQLKQAVMEMDIDVEERDRRLGWLDEKLSTEQFMSMLIKTMSRVKEKRTETTVQAIRLGDMIVTAMPGEAITEHSINFREALAPHTLVMQAYANDHLGYIVNEKVGREGGYEASMGLVNWEQCERIAAEVLELAKGLIMSD
ncbi:MAG: neutral/alkaline non-lysosomal ceramidase N-terminal domain-containing protein [bacterium]